MQQEGSALTSLLPLIVLFAIGQFIALKQYIVLYRAANKVQNTIKVLNDNR